MAIENTVYSVLLAVNIIVSIIIVVLSFKISRTQKKTMQVVMRFFGYGFILVTAHFVIALVDQFGVINWRLLDMFTQTIFLFAILAGIIFAGRTLAAYEHLLGKKKLEGKREWKYEEEKKR